MSKASNLLAILWLLQARPSMTAAEIAERLELDVRTVYRYMDDLLTSGVPVIAESGPAGGYRLAPAFRGAPLHFTPDELAALAHAARLAEGVGHPDGGALASALRKLEQTLTAEQEAALERRRGALTLAGERTAMPGLAAPLERATADRVQVILRYERSGSQTERRVDPYGLFHRGAYWYLVGYCHLRQDLREFRLDRIAAVEPTGIRFEPLSTFDLGTYLAESWIAERVQVGPTEVVRLAGRESLLEQLAGHWYLRHCLAERLHGELRFLVDPIGIKHLPSYLLTFGSALQIREPAHLRQAVANLAREVATHHEDP
jgi:predicted DNA-binding transcriptional regulator YafY